MRRRCWKGTSPRWWIFKIILIFLFFFWLHTHPPGMQRKPSAASSCPSGHTQVYLGECLLICGAGRHMWLQPPFSPFSAHQFVPIHMKQISNQQHEWSIQTAFIIFIIFILTRSDVKVVSEHRRCDLLTRELNELMVDYDILRIVQVAGERHHVGATKFVCTVNSLIFTICPKDPILQRWQGYFKNIQHCVNRLGYMKGKLQGWDSVKKFW